MSFNYEETVMSLIISLWFGRSASMEALSLAKQGLFNESEIKLNEAKAAFHEAHEVQTQLIGHDEGEGKLPITLVMVHAQDHLMTGMLCRELVIELIDLHKKINLSN